MKNLIASLTLEEKAALLTGAASMATERNIPSAVLAWI